MQARLEWPITGLKKDRCATKTEPVYVLAGPRRVIMLKRLGFMTRKTKDATYFPIIFDGHLDVHGLQLYRFR